jgi:hypothetical protein
MKNHNEMYQSLLSRYNEHQEKKKKRIRTIRRTVPVLACLFLTVVLGVGYWSHIKNIPHDFVQPDILEEQTIEIPNNSTTAITNCTSIQSDKRIKPTTVTVSAQSSESERTVNTETNNTISLEQHTMSDNNQQNSETTPSTQQTASDNNETISTSQQTAIESSPSFSTETESPATSDVPKNPMGVLTNINVSYDEAKERFSRDLAECTASSFIGYKAGIVSRNGDINSKDALCVQITYEFTNGIVGIIDQDKMIGSRATYGPKQYDYLDRTFNDETFLNDEQITIGYYPDGDYGLAYVAVFDRSADVYEIMDMIISIEIRN